MKKITVLLLLFVVVPLSAQVQRFYYKYKYVPDSTNREEVKEDMMLLDIDKAGSKYYSYDMFKIDSLANVDLQQQLKSGSGNISINKKLKPGTVSYSVTKTYPDYQVFLHTSISSDKYVVAEEQKPDWKIFSDKQKIGEWNTQKAETDFGGRHWIAWFSTEIPFQDGPYKFYGLPGLIVKVEDITGSHIMTLEGSKTMETVERTSEEVELPAGAVSIGFNKKEIEATKAQFKKAWKSYKSDPAKNMRQMMMSAGGNTKVQFRFMGPDGKEITDNQAAIRAIEQNAKETIKKNNNPIEPDLYN